MRAFSTDLYGAGPEQNTETGIPSNRSRHRVRRGATLLDERLPGWPSRLDAATLNLFNSRLCVLGQLYGDYTLGLGALGIERSAREYGFVPRTCAQAARLADRWRIECRLRRAAT